MAARPDGDTLCFVDDLNREGAVASMADGLLLGRYLDGRGATSEAAFESLVRRHGPAVLAVCRRIVRDDHDAEDAFQATFVVMACRAKEIRDPDRLAAWLGRVARRIARRSRAEATRRADLARRAAADDRRPTSVAAEAVGHETAALVRGEVDRLPEADRLLLRMTYWQGKSYEEAAEALAWPIGTVRSRLSRARDRLRTGLSRLGLAPAAAVALTSATAGDATASQPSAALILKTVRAANGYAGGMTAANGVGVVPASVVALVDGELAMMVTLSWKSFVAPCLVGASLTVGVALVTARAPGGGDGPKALSSPTTAAGKSLLANGSVEEGEGDAPQAWTVGPPVPGVSLTWDRASGHSGKSSLRLAKTAPRYFPVAEWSQQVANPGAGPRLKVSAWVRADLLTKAVLDVQFADARGKGSHAWAAYIGPKEAGKPPVSHDWRRVEGVVAIPPGTKTIFVAPQIYGPGTVWFDDLDAEPTDAPATDPLSP